MEGWSGGRRGRNCPCLQIVCDPKSRDTLSGREGEEEFSVLARAAGRKDSCQKPEESKSKKRGLRGCKSRTSNNDCLPVFASMGSGDYVSDSVSDGNSASISDSPSSYGDRNGRQ